MNLLDDFHLNKAIDELIEHFQSEYPEVFEGFAKKTGSVMAAQKQRQQQAQVGQAMQSSLKAGQQLSQKPAADQGAPAQAGQAAAQPQSQPPAQQQQGGYSPKLEKVMPWLLKYSMTDKFHKDHVLQILRDALKKAA